MTTFDATHPTEEQLRSIDVRELLPQQPPFVMVGSMTYYDERVVKAETAITEENIFVDDLYFSVSGLLENIAQTCALRLGYVNKYILKKNIQIGYIGAIRNFRVERLPRVGETIETEVEALEDVFGMTLAEATIKSGGEVLAATEIKIAVKDE